MTPDEYALLAAVHAAPDDDLPRLVYADWLDERGREADAARAAFIRLHVHLATLDENDPEYDAIDRRCRDLFETYWPVWEAGAPHERYTNAYAHGAVRRGFYDHTHLSDSYFDDPAFRDALPRHSFGDIELGELKADSPLLAWPRWAGVRKLSFCADCASSRDDTAVRRLLASPALAGLRELDLAFSGLADADADLVVNPAFAGLRTLRLRGREVTEAFVRAVLRSPALARLEGLAFRDVPISARTCALFRSATVLPNLRELAFDGRSGGRGRLLALLADARLGPLRALAVTHSGLTDCDVAALRLGDRFPALRSLNLRANGLGPAAAAAVVTDPGLAGLTAVDLSSNPLRGEWVTSLAESPLTGLRRLRLDDCRLTGADVEQLAASPVLRGLRELVVEGNPIGDRGVAALVRSPHLGNLRGLCLRRCGVGPAGVEALAAAPFARRVRFSDLMSNGLDPDWLRDAGPRLFGWDAAERDHLDAVQNLLRWPDERA